MALLLCIETATPVGSVCLSKDGKNLLEKISAEQKDHAAVITPFIREILSETAVSPSQIDAIAISGGPGSYTGLRVAASTAKGLCYAWDVPLIALSTLKIMANGMRQAGLTVPNRQTGSIKDGLLCPLIDARRMEVFSALYDYELNEQLAPRAAILQDDFLAGFKDRKVLMAGTGQPKAEKLFGENNAWTFKPLTVRAAHSAPLAEQAFVQKQFKDTAYFEPFYLKSVYLPGKK